MCPAAHTAHPSHPGAFWSGSAPGSGEQHAAWAKIGQPGRIFTPVPAGQIWYAPCTGGAPARARWRVGEGTDWFTADLPVRTRPMRVAHLSGVHHPPSRLRSQVPGPRVCGCAYYDVKEEKGRMQLTAKRAAESVTSGKKCPGRTGLFFHSVFCLIPQLLKWA